MASRRVFRAVGPVLQRDILGLAVGTDVGLGPLVGEQWWDRGASWMMISTTHRRDRLEGADRIWTGSAQGKKGKDLSLQRGDIPRGR
jgi:hypothetical protein